MVRLDVADVLLVIGCLLIAAGVALWSLPAGVVALGVALIVVSVGIDRATDDRATDDRGAR